MADQLRMVNVRLDPELFGMLEKLIAHDKAELADLGGNINSSTVLRRLIRQEVKRLGVLEEPAPAPKRGKK